MGRKLKKNQKLKETELTLKQKSGKGFNSKPINIKLH